MSRTLPLLATGAVLLAACSDLGSGGSNPPGTTSAGGAGNVPGGGGSGAGINLGVGPEGTAGVTSGPEGAAGTSPVAGPVESGRVEFTLECAQPAVGSPVLRLLTRSEFENTINDVFPSAAGAWSDTLPANAVSAAGFDNSAAATVGNQLAEKLLETAEAIGTAVSGTLSTTLPCSATSADRACAEEFVNTYGRRLFRRDVSPAELERYLTFFDSALAKSDFPTAIKWVTVGLVQSPNAVYRSEIGEPDASGGRALTPHEIATEIAYTFSGSTPTEELLAAADSGNLGDVAAIVAGLLETERGQLALQRFFEGYLSFPRVAATQKPNIPEFSNVSADMVEETRSFIMKVAYDDRAGLRELLTENTTNPSAALAAYYGYSAPAADYASMERPAGHGVGVLAQGSFLATNASADASSPTRRGLFGFLRVLCQAPPPLPDDVPNLDPPEPGVRTTRQRYEDLHAQAGTACQACHVNFDPIGFAFEHFDEGGRYRESEQGLPIDATGAVLDGTGLPLFSFDGQAELMAGLVELDVTYQCFSAYLATFAFGSTASCLGPTRALDLKAGTIGLVEAFAALAEEPHFTRRAAE